MNKTFEAQLRDNLKAVYASGKAEGFWGNDKDNSEIWCDPANTLKFLSSTLKELVGEEKERYNAEFSFRGDNTEWLQDLFNSGYNQKRQEVIEALKREGLLQ